MLIHLLIYQSSPLYEYDVCNELLEIGLKIFFLMWVVILHDDEQMIPS